MQIFDHTTGNHFSFHLIRIFHVLACAGCLFIHWGTALRSVCSVSSPPSHQATVESNIFQFMTNWRCLPWALATSPGITALPFRVPGHIPVWHCLQTYWGCSLSCHYSISANPWQSSLGLTTHWLDFVPPITTPWDQFSSPFSAHLMPVSIPCLST